MRHAASPVALVVALLPSLAAAQSSVTRALTEPGSATASPTGSATATTSASSATRSAWPSASTTRTPAAAGQQPPGATRQLAGRYIRIGVNSVGTLGSIGNAPPGIQVDYSGTGFFLDAYDFLTPGSPFEGWSVKYGPVGAPTTHSNNNAGPSNSITGVLYIYSGVPYRNETWDNRAVWVGTAAGAYTIHHDVRFNRDDDVISIVTHITATAPLPRAFFARYTDPDARVSPLDTSVTRNARGWGPIPPSNIVLSEALASGYTQGLMSTQQGFVGTGVTKPWSKDPEVYFSGGNSGPQGDDSIGIGFSLGDVPAGRTVFLTYAYIFGTGLFKVDKSVSMEPAWGSMFGGTLVTVTPGATLNASSALLCRWGAGAAGDLSAVVPATYATNATATCAAPFSLKLGAATLWFSSTGGASWGYIGVYTYVAPDAGGLLPLLLRPGSPDSGSADGGPLLWPSTISGAVPAELEVFVSLAWLLVDRELWAVSRETLYYSLELFEITDTLGTADAWVGAAGPRYQGGGSGGGGSSSLLPVTPAVQAALAATELAAHVAVLRNGTSVSPGGARLLGAVDTWPLGFGMTYADRTDGSEGSDVSAYLAMPVPLAAFADTRSPLAVRPVFARLTARDTRGGRPLVVRTSSLRWLLPGSPPPAATPVPRGAAAVGSRSASPTGSPTASSTVLRGSSPLPVAFDAHTACAAWKALRRDPATWNRGLPQCPQIVAQLSRSQWVPLNDCSGLNGSVAVTAVAAAAAVAGGDGGDGGDGAVDAWGTAPCWAHRGRAAFGEVDARSCFVSAVANANHAAASCCYDLGGRLLRAGAGSASDARFAPSPARLSHVFADELPRLVCCRLSGVREDCDGVVRATGGFSWRGAGGAVGDPHFVSLDGAQLAFNGVGDFVYVGIKTAPSVATPRIVSLPASPGRPWGTLPAGVSFVSFVRLLPLSLLYPDGSPAASAVRGWAAVTSTGEHVSVTVRGGALQVHINGTMLPLGTETSGFVDAFYASSAFARSRGALTALARTARFCAGNGTAAAAAEVAARGALASGALDSSAADVTFSVGNVTIVFSRAQRRVLVTLPHVGVAVTISQVRSNVTALDGALLFVSADVASSNFGCTWGLLGNYDGVAANDERTHGEPSAPLATEAAVFASINAALRVQAPNAAFTEALPTLPSPFTPVFTAALPAPGTAGVDAVLLRACGVVANASSSSGPLPFAQAACYLDGTVTRAVDVGASTLRLVRELEEASASARGPAPEFASPPTSLALRVGSAANVTLSASVPVFVPSSPAEVVLFRVESSPSGACSVGERSGLLVCGPLVLSDAGLTPAANGSHASGGVVVVASTQRTGASTLHQLLLVVAAVASPSTSVSASASQSASRVAITSAVESVTPTLGGVAASRSPDGSLSPIVSATLARNESDVFIVVAGASSGPANAGGTAAGGVIAALVVAAAFIAYRRRKAARGVAPKPATVAAAKGDQFAWHDHASSRPSLPQPALAPASSGGGPATNPILLAQFASTRRLQPASKRGATQRASFAPQAQLHASARYLDAGSSSLDPAEPQHSHRALVVAAIASPSSSTRQLLAEHQSLSMRRFGGAGASPGPSARSLSSRSLVVASSAAPEGAGQLSRQSSARLVRSSGGAGASPGASTRNLSSRTLDSLA